MCQAYEAEARLVTMWESDSRAKGWPGYCNQIKGYVRCDYVQVPLMTRFRNGQEGWICPNCDHFYPVLEAANATSSQFSNLFRD